MPNQPRVALILAGCGVYDGSEIQEAVACIFALDQADARVTFFAPDKPQAHVIDHTTGEPTQESRNVLIESARIARGHVQPLDQLDARNLDAPLIPGGIGAAKNPCTFASDGPDMTVDSQVEQAVKEFTQHDKPIGMCCIAPIIAAKALSSPGKPATLTLGGPSDAATAATTLGAQHIETAVDQTATDDNLNLVTAPAYMYGDATPSQVKAGIDKMIHSVLSRINANT